MTEAAQTTTETLLGELRDNRDVIAHGRWRYRRIHPTGYEWTTPHGYRILRDHHGTHPAVPPGHPPHPET